MKLTLWNVTLVFIYSILAGAVEKCLTQLVIPSWISRASQTDFLMELPVTRDSVTWVDASERCKTLSNASGTLSMTSTWTLSSSFWKTTSLVLSLSSASCSGSPYPASFRTSTERGQKRLIFKLFFKPGIKLGLLRMCLKFQKASLKCSHCNE